MAMVERRHADRVRVDQPCVVVLEGRQVPARLEDLSEHGALFRVEHGGEIFSEDLGCEAAFVLSTSKPRRRYTGEVIRMFFREETAYFALRFWKPFVEEP